MNLLNWKFRAAMSVALAVVFASVFTFRSFAAPTLTERHGRAADSGAAGMNLSGTPLAKLSGTGHFTIDGDEAQDGATVLSGSRVGTGPDGYATVDLDSRGRIELRPNTVVTLAVSADTVEVSLERAGSIVQVVPSGMKGRLNVRGERARLAVTRGEVEVRTAAGATKLASGRVSALDEMAEVVSSGDAIFTAEAIAQNDKGVVASDQPAPAGPQEAPAPRRKKFVSAGWLGMVALTGVAAAVTVGVIKGAGHGSSSATAPRPSTVVP